MSFLRINKETIILRAIAREEAEFSHKEILLAKVLLAKCLADQLVRLKPYWAMGLLKRSRVILYTRECSKCGKQRQFHQFQRLCNQRLIEREQLPQNHFAT